MAAASQAREAAIKEAHAARENRQRQRAHALVPGPAAAAARPSSPPTAPGGRCAPLPPAPAAHAFALGPDGGSATLVVPLKKKNKNEFNPSK